MKAYAYGKLLIILGIEPTDFQVIQEATVIADKQKKVIRERGNQRNQAILYQISHIEAIDDLLKEGYKIMITFENYERFNGDEDAAYQHVKGDPRKMIKNSPKRNKKVIEDILVLAEKSDKDKTKTNIFLIMGSYHIFIKDLLPENLKHVTETSFDESRVGGIASILLAEELIKLLEE